MFPCGVGKSGRGFGLFSTFVCTGHLSGRVGCHRAPSGAFFFLCFWYVDKVWISHVKVWDYLVPLYVQAA
jgi:hypothetical protein